MAEFSVIGQRVPQLDAKEKVTGEAAFTGDTYLTGMLYGKVLMSPHPHAKIKSINTSKAEALPGVGAVVTYKDAEDLPWPHMDLAVISDTMRYVGDIVAAAAATDRDIANAALDLIEVEYEILPFVLDPEEASQPGAVQVHAEVTDNNVVTHEPLVEEHGDIAKGFAEADHILEDRYTVHQVSASAAEPRVCVASWESTGRLTFWSSTQSIGEVHEKMAQIFGLGMNMVRGIMDRLGGGFGNKDATYLEPLTALLAKKADKPVQLAYLSQEEILGGRLRHAMFLDSKLGIKNDGTITAVQAKHTSDGGAYSDASIGVTSVSMGPITDQRMFRCANVEAMGYPTYTNRPVSGAYRGFGNPQASVPMQLMLGRSAEKLGMDPVEFLLQNLWSSGEDARANGADMVDSYFGLSDCITQGAEAAGWKSKWKGWETPVAVNGAKKRGIGFGAMVHVGGGGFFIGQASAIVKVNRDGTIQLICGACCSGNAIHTTQVQVCAESMGVPYEDVYETFGDTDSAMWVVGNYASRTAHSHAIAVKAACEKAKEQLFETAAGILEATAEELDVKDRSVFVKGAPQRAVSLKDIMAARALQDVVGSAGTHSIMEGGAIFGAQFAEVEVDTETGEVEVLKVVAAHDVGTAINPTVCEAQLEGGVMQGGLGYALTESLL